MKIDCLTRSPCVLFVFNLSGRLYGLISPDSEAVLREGDELLAGSIRGHVRCEIFVLLAAAWLVTGQLLGPTKEKWALSMAI